MREDDLRLFGLTENEVRAYIALARFGRQTPGELAPRAGVSRGRVYQVLGELCRKGFATEIQGKQRSFAPVDPSVALEATVRELREETEKREALLAPMCSWLEALGSSWEGKLPAIEVLGRPDQIAQRFQRLQLEAEREILVFNKAPYIGPGHNPGELKALGRGVRYAALYERAALADPAYLQDVARFTEAGEQARVVDEVPMKMAVFDRSRALMPLASTHDPALPFTPVVVHDAGLALTLSYAFDHLWERAAEIELPDIAPSVATLG